MVMPGRYWNLSGRGKFVCTIECLRTSETEETFFRCPGMKEDNAKKKLRMGYFGGVLDAMDVVDFSSSESDFLNSGLLVVSSNGHFHSLPQITF
jgi:hypothetical protein